MKYLLSFFSLFFVFSCQGQKEKETITNEPMKEYKYKTDKRMVYGIDLTVPGPFELYINDIAARKDYSPAMHNTLVDINPHVLKSGKYKFKFRLLPMPSELEKGGIQPHTLKFLHVALAQYEKVKEGEGAEPNTYKVTFQYPIPVINKPVPFLDIEGEFEVELPYELEGWSKGQNLAKMDKDILEEKVVKYYKKLCTILNNGEGEVWMEITGKRREETIAFNYSNIEDFKLMNIESIEEINTKCKNNVLPIEDYRMHIYGDGKLVSLERESHTEEMNNKPLNAKGESPLIRKGLIRGVSYYPVILYLPQDSDEFVIIRK